MSTRFRRQRPRAQARQALTADEEAAAGHWLDTITTDPADGASFPPPPGHTAGHSAVIWFDGASDLGVMPPGAVAIKETGKDTQPIAMAKLRARPAPNEGYAPDATGPLFALTEPLTEPPAIGDALARDDEWGPKLAPVPCGKCGSIPLIPDYILDRTIALGHVNWLAIQAGWKYDAYLRRVCPDCQQGGKHRAAAS